MKTNYNENLGFLSSISASALFALVTLYVQILKPLSGFVIAGQRHSKMYHKDTFVSNMKALVEVAKSKVLRFRNLINP